LDQQQAWFLLLLVLLATAGVFVANVARSRAGRAWQAVRDNEAAASIMGVNLFTAKMGAFVLSSFLAGIAGALSASYTEHTSPTAWNLLLSIQLIAAILIGGVASVWGSILGAAFVFALPNVFGVLSQGTGSTSVLIDNLNPVFYGLFIIVFLLFEPAGLIGIFRRVQVYLGHREAQHKGGDSAAAHMASTTDTQLDVEVSRLPRGSN
jgi:branched-chain amino acid transport system permease protein